MCFEPKVHIPRNPHRLLHQHNKSKNQPLLPIHHPVGTGPFLKRSASLLPRTLTAILAQFSATRAPGLLGSKADEVKSWSVAIIQKRKKEKSRYYHWNIHIHVDLVHHVLPDCLFSTHALGLCLDFSNTSPYFNLTDTVNMHGTHKKPHGWRLVGLSILSNSTKKCKFYSTGVKKKSAVKCSHFPPCNTATAHWLKWEPRLSSDITPAFLEGYKHRWH